MRLTMEKRHSENSRASRSALSEGAPDDRRGIVGGETSGIGVRLCAIVCDESLLAMDVIHFTVLCK